MATLSLRRGTRIRAVVIGALIVGAAATVPARAVDAPVLEETSVDSGWSATTEAVAARFDKVLDPDGSSVTLEEVGGAVIAGWHTRVEGTTVILSAVDPEDPNGPAGDPLRVDGTEYRATFSVVGEAPSAPDEPEVHGPFTFQVDPDRPTLPVITRPSPLFRQEIHIGGDDQAGTPEIAVIELAPADPSTPVAEFAGTAADATGTDGDLTATSGIASVELRFFNPLANPLNPEAVAFSVTLDDASHLTAPGAAETEWSIAAEDITDEDGASLLSPGLWAVRAVASDMAGSISAPSKAVQILVL